MVPSKRTRMKKHIKTAAVLIIGIIAGGFLTYFWSGFDNIIHDTVAKIKPDA